MEAAKGVMDTLAELGRQSGDEKLQKLLAAHFLSRGATLQALQLASGPLAAARQVPPGQAAQAAALPALPAALKSLPETAASLQSVGELSEMARVQLAAGGDKEQALTCVEELSSAMCALGDKPSEAASLGALSSACAACGGSQRDGARAAASALRVARETGDKAAIAAALKTVVNTSFAFKDPDQALRAAAELAKLSNSMGDKSAEAGAKLAIARAQLVNEEPQSCLEASTEAATMFKALKNKEGQAAALSVAFDVDILLGRPASASKRAKEVLDLVKGQKKAEAAATLMLGSVDTATQEALKACRKAGDMFRDLKDRAGEAAASVATANSLLCQGGKSADEGLKSARAALATFKELSSASGEAAALATVGAAHTQLGDFAAAEQALREAIALFGQLRDTTGEAYASSLLKSAKAAAIAPSKAEVTIDEAASLAHIELSDTSSAESMREAIAAVQGSKSVTCVVVHLDGAPPGDGADAAERGRAFGTFLAGLRMLSLPVVVSVCGKISGPMWALVLTTDYRIAATSTVFFCPVWGSPQCLGELVGHNAATQLCVARGPKDALQMLENGIVHQLQKGKEDTRTAAVEMARRVAASPDMACRRRPFVHHYFVEDYAMAAIKGV